MITDGIRLSAEARRLANSPVTETSPSLTKTSQPTSNALPISSPSPLLTVVLETNTLIEGRKESLYELVLQNDPKSAPPVRLNADTLIPPGTSLLLVKDENGYYQPVEKPTLEQLSKLIQLELNYQRAHLLPKFDIASRQQLPAATTNELASQFPALKPLLNWFTQTTIVTSPTVIQQLFQQFSGLSTIREWPAVNQTATLATSEKQTQNLSSQSINPALTSSSTPSSTSNAAQSSQMNSNLLITAALTKQLTADTLTVNSQNQSAVQPNRRSNEPFNIGVSNIRPLPEQPSLVARLVNVVEKPLLITSPIAINRPTTLNLIEHGSAANAPQTPLLSKNQTTQAVLNHVSLNTQQTETMFAVSNNLFAPKPQSTPTPTIEALTSPTPERPLAPSQIQRPLEIVLSQWLQKIDTLISNNPNLAQAQLVQNAKDLLKTQNLPNDAIEQLLSKTTNEKSEEPLLALRAAIESIQARIQHSLVQTASYQWAVPDQPAIQHAQLPLIWLGLTAWADVEWWKEKPKHKKQGTSKDEKKQQQRWRMKLYLTLPPLSEVCADIDWQSEHSQVTFWSEDRQTLAQMNQHLPTLNSWTADLGERTLQTKHGMPKRSSQANTNPESHHLVDIRT